MSISLYDISAATYLQILGAVSGVLAKGAAYCKEEGISLDEVVETRLIEDMFTFRFQIISVAHNTLGSIKGLQSGTIGPPTGAQDQDYAGLQALIADTEAEIREMTPDDINALAKNEVVFQIGDFKLPFSATNFVLSFSHPNVYFHATTAYDILRMKGVPVGKQDFIGQPRLMT